MSKALAREYRCAPPGVIYNAFPLSERNGIDGRLKDRVDRHVPSIHWFSQTLGPGRGLEDLLDALPYVSRTVAIHLRGMPSAGFEAWLWNRVPQLWRRRIFIHDLVPNDELLSRIAEHDIGFAGEMKYCSSRDLTVTNKILQYLLAGLAVVASDTAGQKEVAEQAPKAVFLYPAGDAVALAGRINELLEDSKTLDHAKIRALQASDQIFCWERQEKSLLDAIARTLSKPVSSR
jgi:glycosyltransferase involved in cell wall biosynthesis